MKFNFKKIIPILAGALLLGSTMGFAAAVDTHIGDYPSPFVKNGVGNVAIIYGAAASVDDALPAGLINGNLANFVTTAGAVSVTGDNLKVERTSDKFNLGNEVETFYSSIDDDELEQLLTPGVYVNDDNDEFDFDQKIDFTGTAITLTHFQDSEFNDDEPIIAFDLASGAHIFNYTLTFTENAEGGAGLDLFETTDLTMLGRTYYWLTATNTTALGQEFTLLDSANTAIIAEGNATTVIVAGKSYGISIVYIDTTDVILKVNGVQTNKLSEGDTFKVAEDTYIAVKNNLYNEKESGISNVEISIGSGKIVLKNGEEVELNTEDVDGLKAYISMSGNNLQKIVLEWNLDDDAWIAPGTDLVLSGLETVKLSMLGFNVAKKEMTSISNDGDDKLTLNTFVKDGDVSLNLLYLNSSNSGFAGIGKDSDEKLVTSTINSIVLNKSIQKYFVASAATTREAESYVLELRDIDDSDPVKNTTTIRNLASGNDITIDIGETETLDLVNLKLEAANERTGVVNFSISGTGYTFNKLYTKEGLKIQLPIDSVVTGDGYINITGAQGNLTDATYEPATFVMNFTEENKDGNINTGSSFTSTLGSSSEGAQVNSVSVDDFETEDGSDNYVGYVSSDLATKTLIKTGGDQDTLDIEYHGTEAYADVYVSAPGAVATTGGSSAFDVMMSDAGAIPDAELIVIGGSCVNKVSAQLLGLTYPACGSAFTEKTLVGKDQAILRLMSNPSYSTKSALLVAGWEAKDTRAAAKALYVNSAAYSGKTEVVLNTVTETVGIVSSK